MAINSCWDSRKRCYAKRLTPAAAEIAPFGGECSHNEINRLRDIAGSAKCTAVLGIGGGKTTDTAKALAHFMKVPVAIAPTIASTDAPCSALSVIYTDEGEFDSYLMLPHNLTWSLSIRRSLLARRLACWPPGLAMRWPPVRSPRLLTQRRHHHGGREMHRAALALAELCYNTLLEEGEKAMLAAEQHVVTPALERVVEANTYLSGVGFESGGLAAAHAIHNGMTAIPDAHHYYHGEKVAFGTLTQLVLENAPMEEIETVAALCHSVGLPITLAQLDIKGDIPTKMRWWRKPPALKAKPSTICRAASTPTGLRRAAGRRPIWPALPAGMGIIQSKTPGVSRVFYVYQPDASPTDGGNGKHSGRTHAQRMTDGVAHFGAVKGVEVEIFTPSRLKIFTMSMAIFAPTS